jgi:hypothetical protein
MNRISQFLYDETCGGLLCLENENGCMRDLHGRPIVLSIGMVFGTTDDMTTQVEYAVNNAIEHLGDNNEFCTVIETNHTSFRFPDSQMKELFDLLRFKYLQNIGTIHFINLSMRLRMGIHIALSLVPYELRSKIVLHKNTRSFLKYMPAHCHLKRWDGNIEFNINEYVDMRCKLENVQRSVERACINKVNIQNPEHSILLLAKESLTSQGNVDKFILRKMNYNETTSKLKQVILEDDFVYIYDNINTSWRRHFCISKSEIHIEHPHKIRVTTPIRDFVFIADNQNDCNTFMTAFMSRKVLMARQ